MSSSSRENIAPTEQHPNCVTAELDNQVPLEEEEEEEETTELDN